MHIADRFTDKIEKLLRTSDTTLPGLWNLYVYEGEICLNRRAFVPKNANIIIYLSGNDIKTGLTGRQWSQVHNKLITLMLKKGLNP